MTSLEQRTNYASQCIFIDTKDIVSQHLTSLHLYLRDQAFCFLTRRSLCGNAHIAGIEVRIRRHRGICVMDQSIQPLFDSGFTHTIYTQDTCEDHPSSVGGKSRYRLVLPHSIHLARYAGHCHENAPIFLDPPTWSCPY